MDSSQILKIVENVVNNINTSNNLNNLNNSDNINNSNNGCGCGSHGNCKTHEKCNSHENGGTTETDVHKHGHNCNCKKKLTLDIAEKVSKAVEEKAAEMGVNAVVAMTNEGANPVLVHCMEDSFIASYDVALSKAYTVVALKMSTINLKELAQPGGSLYGIQNTNNGRIVIFGGGEPLMIKGKVIGGLGVSGGTEEQDTKLAAYGKEIFESLLNE